MRVAGLACLARQLACGTSGAAACSSSSFALIASTASCSVSTSAHLPWHSMRQPMGEPLTQPHMPASHPMHLHTPAHAAADPSHPPPVPSTSHLSYSTSSAPSPRTAATPSSYHPYRRPTSHVVPYSLRSGTSRPAPWPVIEPIALNAAGEAKWHRTLYRFPEEVQVSVEDAPPPVASSSQQQQQQGAAAPAPAATTTTRRRELVLTGRAGTIRLDLAQLDPSGLVAFKLMTLGGSPSNSTSSNSSGSSGGGGTTAAAAHMRHMLAVATPDKARFASFVAELDASVRGVTVGYLVGLTVKGVGYRMEPMAEAPRKRSWYFDDDKADGSALVFPHPTPVPAIRLKVGYSRTAVFPFPPGIRAFCIKPTLLYLYGLRKEEVDAVAQQVRGIRRPNVYTGNGIQLLDEVVRKIQRKASK